MRYRRLPVLILALVMAGLVGPLPGSAQAPTTGSDLTAQGRLGVRRDTYDLGQTAFEVKDFPNKIELTGVVHSPATRRPNGKYPLVLFVHGRHLTCFRTADRHPATTDMWPCKPGYEAIPSYRGFDYLGEQLASHGYVVVSVGANGISAGDAELPDRGARARAELIEKHLQLWAQWSTKGGDPFGTRFLGQVDLDSVGLMGHSRAGEAVVVHNTLYAATATAYKVKALFGLAPSNKSRKAINGTSFGVMVPTCDGDAIDLQGLHYYDDSRYLAAGDPTGKHAVVLPGANHNNFNSLWSPSSDMPAAGDDPTTVTRGRGMSCDPRGPNRLNELQQRQAAVTYVNGFFRYHLGADSALRPLWTGAAMGPVPALVSYHPPDRPASRLAINPLATADDLKVNRLGGAVRPAGLKDPKIAPARNWPHTSTTPDSQPVSFLQADWDQPGASVANDLPAPARNVSAFAAVQFRTALRIFEPKSAFTSLNPELAPQDLSVVLTDGQGRSRSVPAAPYTQALRYPVSWEVQFTILNQVRVPLSAFSGIDLADVREVRLAFDRTPAGSLVFSDLLLAE